MSFISVNGFTMFEKGPAEVLLRNYLNYYTLIAIIFIDGNYCILIRESRAGTRQTNDWFKS